MMTSVIKREAEKDEDIINQKNLETSKEEFKIDESMGPEAFLKLAEQKK